MSLPRYITLEGVDAVGKTTLLDRLRSHYESRGQQVCIKPEFPLSQDIAVPINDALARSIFIAEGFASGPAAAFFFMLYAEMAAITALPRQPRMLIGDRGLDSLCIYQGAFVAGRTLFRPERIVSALESLYASLGLRIPDRTLLLTLPAPALSSRFAKRNGRSPSPQELAQLLWLQEQFEAVAAHKARFVVLDVEDEPNSVLDRAVRAIET